MGHFPVGTKVGFWGGPNKGKVGTIVPKTVENLQAANAIDHNGRLFTGNIFSLIEIKGEIVWELTGYICKHREE